MVEVASHGGRARDGQELGNERFVIEESLGYLVNYAARALAKAHGEALAPHGVTVAQWAVLIFLWEEDGLSQKELSRRVAIEEPTMVRTLDRMERDGLVRRQRSARDRRRSNVFLTEPGWALRDVLVPCAVAVNAAAERALSEAERSQLRHLLHEVITALRDEPIAEVPA